MDPWFVDQMAEIVEVRSDIEAAGSESRDVLVEAKRYGFSDRQIAHLWGDTEADVREARARLEVNRTYKTVDTCAGEFEANTPYMYGTFEEESEVPPLRPTFGWWFSRIRSRPDRSGHRVRLLLCPRRMLPCSMRGTRW